MINTDLAKKCGKRLKECREAMNITQQQLASACYCTAQHISYLENGKKRLTRDLAHRFSETLKVNELYLLCETNYKTYDDELSSNASKYCDIQNLQMDYLKALGHTIISVGDLTTDSELYDIPDVGIKSIGGQIIIDNDYDNPISTVDFFELLEDLNAYTEFLLSRAAYKNKHRLARHKEEYFRTISKTNK